MKTKVGPQHYMKPEWDLYNSEVVVASGNYYAAFKLTYGLTLKIFFFSLVSDTLFFLKHYFFSFFYGHMRRFDTCISFMLIAKRKSQKQTQLQKKYISSSICLTLAFIQFGSQLGGGLKQDPISIPKTIFVPPSS